VLNWASHHEYIWRRGNIFLLFALHGGEQSSSLPGYLTPCTHRTGGWVSIWAGLGTVEKRKISCPFQKMNPAPVCSLLIIMISYKLIYLKTAKNLFLENIFQMREFQQIHYIMGWFCVTSHFISPKKWFWKLVTKAEIGVLLISVTLYNLPF
jgi:hypothetical protein